MDYGDTLLKLNSALQVVDYFTPMDQSCRGGHDVDLGSVRMTADCADAKAANTYPNEIVFGGKGGTPCDLWTGGVYAAPLYVVNRDNMGKYNATQDMDSAGNRGRALFGYWSSPAYTGKARHANYVYAAGTRADADGVGDNLKQYTLSSGLLYLKYNSR